MKSHPFERLSYDPEYDQALSYLYGLQKFGIKFGLSKTENLLKAFDHPQRYLKLIHIAGSNGKGSVAAMLSSIYSLAGYQVGLFTSPHLIDFRERFQINGRMISKVKTLDLIKEIRERTNLLEPPTFFEFVTAMALVYFYRAQVDLAIMEVGLGGRLDATNIIQPLITAITNISLEHQKYLGGTLNKIAWEKAGIIKFQVPLVTGVSQKKIQGLLEEICQERQVPMFLAGRDFRTRKLKNGKFSYYGMPKSEFGEGVDALSRIHDAGYTMQGSREDRDEGRWTMDQVLVTPNSELQTPNTPPPNAERRTLNLTNLCLGLLGDHQIQNAGLAITMIDCLKQKYPVKEEAIRDGLSRVTWPGRMEVLSQRPWIVLDGAHNPGAMRTIAQNLHNVFSYKKLLLIFGMMKDKDIERTLNCLIPLVDILFLTKAEYERSADPEAIIPFIRGETRPFHVFRTIPSAIKKAMKEAEPEDLILITGSLFVVGEARAWWERKGSRP